MIDKPVHTEKRKSARCRFRAVDYKVFIGASQVIGEIKDISLDGLSFTYNPSSGDTFAEKTIDMLTIACRGFQLSEISCDKRYDIRAMSEGQTFSGKMTRRCGVRFVNLTILNKFKIKQMLHMCHSRIFENVSKSK
jgi:hypothetical protein